MRYEYIVIAAPTRIERAKRKLSAAERLADTMTAAINEMAADGWEYLRTETMTVEDKKGRFSKVEEVIETVLVFRRSVAPVEPVRRARERIETVNEPPRTDPARQAVEAKPNRFEPAERIEPVLKETDTTEIEKRPTPSVGGVTRG